MLDTRTSCLLRKINLLCGDGGFKIAEEEELLSCFPQETNVGAEELNRILRYLEERRYIDVQYADGGVYCLCPLPEGRLYFETEREALLETGRRRREGFLSAFFGSFAGALLGALVVLMISLLAR